MAGYRGDGYGAYGDHGDDDFYRDMRSGRHDESSRWRGDDWRMRDRPDERSRHGDDDRRGFMFGGRGDNDRWDSGDRDDDRHGGMMERAGERMRSWVRDDDHDGDHHYGGRGARDRDRGEGFLERSGHQARGWMHDDSSDEDRRRGMRLPLGTDDRSRQGGGLGMGGGQERPSRADPHHHYLSWRERQMAELDRDYDEYCRENERKFSSDFESWRQNRRMQQGTGGGMSGGMGATSGSGSMSSAGGEGSPEAMTGSMSETSTGSDQMTSGNSPGEGQGLGTDESAQSEGRGSRTRR